MPIKLKIVLFGIGPMIALDLINRPLRKKYVEIARAAAAVNEQNHELQAQLAYLIDVINAHDIVLDEFDLIVLNNLMKT